MTTKSLLEASFLLMTKFYEHSSVHITAQNIKTQMNIIWVLIRTHSAGYQKQKLEAIKKPLKEQDQLFVTQYIRKIANQTYH